jgi:DnaJ-class molecular chaperone
MDRLQGPPTTGAEGPQGACPSCGGSGVLRTDGTSYRTCLACVGQGVLPQFEAQFSSSDALSLAMARAMGRGRGFRGDLSAWISGAK